MFMTFVVNNLGRVTVIVSLDVCFLTVCLFVTVCRVFAMVDIFKLVITNLLT